MYPEAIYILKIWSLGGTQVAFWTSSMNEASLWGAFVYSEWMNAKYGEQNFQFQNPELTLYPQKEWARKSLVDLKVWPFKDRTFSSWEGIVKDLFLKDNLKALKNL